MKTTGAIQLWGRQSSSNVQATLWALEELGLAYERTDAGLMYGVVDSDAYGAMNPNRTVPTLIDGDGPPLFEAGAVLRYLATQYSDDAFWPANPIRRAQVDMWAEWSKLNIALKFTAPVFWKVVRTAPSKRDPGAIAANLETLTHFLRIAEMRLERTAFLVGEQLSLADIQFGHCLYRYFEIDIERPGLPALRRYYDDLTARPAFQHAVMVDYGELRVFD